MSDSEIFNLHLKAALLLVREFRLKAWQQHLDAKAVRVAIKYMLLVDTYLAKEHGLTDLEDKELDALAETLFKQTPKGEMHGGVGG